MFVLSNVADQAAFVLGPAGGSMICQRATWELYSESFAWYNLEEVFVIVTAAFKCLWMLKIPIRPFGSSHIRCTNQVSFPLMCQGFGGCMMLYALYLSSFSLWSTLWPEKSGEEACGNNPDNSVSST